METVIIKIQKLLAFKEDAQKRDSEAEVQNVTLKIQALLMKHNLDLAQVEVKPELVKKTSIGGDDTTFNKREGDWVGGLISVLAQANLCRAILQNVSGRGLVSVSIIGMPSNTQVVRSLSLQLIPRIRNLEKEAWREYLGRDKRGSYRRSYLRYLVYGIHDTLEKQKMQQEAENNKITALVKVHDSQVQEFIDNNYDDLRKSKSTRLGSNDGASQGFNDGKKMSINQGLKAH